MAEILDLPMGENDAKAATIREYLVALLAAVWEREESFSGKRPFGNSSWKYEVYAALGAGGVIAITRSDEDDDDFDISPDEAAKADDSIRLAIAAMGTVSTGKTG